MVKTYNSFNTNNTPQSEPIPGSGQVANAAGGFTWDLDMWGKLDRFLVLGTEGGTYYISEKTLTRANAESVIKAIQADGPRVVARIVEISTSGRAAKNDPALFALALCFSFGDNETKSLAKAALPQVARIGTHLFHFAQYVEQFRGWGRVLKTAVSNWYDSKPEQAVAYDVTKYQSRDGWSHKDLIRLSHPSRHGDIYNYVVNAADIDHNYIGAVELLKIEGTQSETPTSRGLALINEFTLPREVVPTQWLNSPETWEALLPQMGLEAMVRNLGNMSKSGLLVPLSEATKTVVEKLGNEEAIKRSRIHPIKILVGSRQYSAGHGLRGSNTWKSVPQVVSALNEAFYTAFQNVEPTYKRLVLALDVSSSMTGGMVAGAHLSPLEAEAALALVTASTEPNYYVMGFSTEFRDLGINASDTLESAIRKASDQRFGGTDCAVPMNWAEKNKISVDSFVVYTDNETWAGNRHPSQALKSYRKSMNIPQSKLVVVGMVANSSSIADPNDPGMLDVVGFDTATPALISDFIR